MLRITAYADRLLDGLDSLDWDEGIKEQQRHWIGRSEGVDIVFPLDAGPGASLPPATTLTAFTTRADTLFGVTYVCVAPEHPLVSALTAAGREKAVSDYIAAAASKSDMERTDATKTRAGVDTGSFATHPVTGARLPVWVADYVIGGYGSGAVMAVPAHDARDAEFAAAHGLPVVDVVRPVEGGDGGGGEPSAGPFTDEGVVFGSSAPALDLNGLSSADARTAVASHLESTNSGGPRVSYRLRDWLFARQRYWGEPFPVCFDEETGALVPLDDADLPLILPDTDSFAPTGTGDPPLAAVPGFARFTHPVTGRPLVRETSTMPQWAGSCWYYVRYLQPDNTERIVDPAAAAYWLPVDLYVGGAEHATLHLLYARFWHKVLFDLGVVPTDEPFARLVSQGMILGAVEHTAWRAGDGSWCNEGDAGATPVPVAEADTVKGPGGGLVLAAAPHARVASRAHKMSKSRGNVVNPDDVVFEFGADRCGEERERGAGGEARARGQPVPPPPPPPPPPPACACTRCSWGPCATPRCGRRGQSTACTASSRARTG